MKLYRGCDLLLFAKVEQDDAAAYRTNSPERLAALQGLLLPAFKNATQIVRDGVPVGVYHAETMGAALQINTEGLSENEIAYLTGSGENAESGFFVDTGETTVRYFACGCRVKYSDGSYKYIWFLKGVFIAQDRTVNTEQGTEAAGSSLLFMPCMTDHVFENGKNARSVSVEASATDRELNAESWGGFVWTPDNLANVEVPVIWPGTDNLTVGDNVNISIEYEVTE